MLYPQQVRARPFLTSAVAALAIAVAVLAGAATPSRAEGEAPRDAGGSLLEDNNLVVYYGSPRYSGLGVLGTTDAVTISAGLELARARFDEANGDRGAVGAMELIYGMALADPGKYGNYVGYLNDRTVRRYIETAEENDQIVILDLQIGRGRILDEVRKIERFLRDPRVHVAIDPEYAVGPQGVPIETPGRITGEEINDVQRYLARIARRYGLPNKLLVVHQYMDETIVDGAAVERVAGVDLVLNMDAYGAHQAKIEKYLRYAARPYAHYRSYNVFLKQDERVPDVEELLDIWPAPDVIMYQ